MPNAFYQIISINKIDFKQIYYDLFKQYSNSNIEISKFMISSTKWKFVKKVVIQDLILNKVVTAKIINNHYFGKKKKLSRKFI